MTPKIVADTARHALIVITIALAILLIPALLVGLLVSMFQAATQINEMTLSFIPKLLVTLGALMVGGPYLIGLMTDFTVRLMKSIPFLIG